MQQENEMNIMTPIEIELLALLREQAEQIV